MVFADVRIMIYVFQQHPTETRKSGHFIGCVAEISVQRGDGSGYSLAIERKDGQPRIQYRFTRAGLCLGS